MKIRNKLNVGSAVLKGCVLASTFAISFAYALEPLTVSGNQILAGGEPKSFAGMSLFWSNNGWGGEKFYQASAVEKMKSDMNATLVRAAMGVDENGGYFDDPDGNEARVRRVVEAAIANDMYVIIDWHSHHAHEHDWSEAINFFSRMAKDYGHYENVIYEIYNEPLQVPWSEIKPYSEAVISAIRVEDPDNLIVVGTPQWSQKVDEASQDPIDGVNIAYTLHFYAATHSEWLRSAARTALDNGIALFATEWGSVSANGDGSVDHSSTDAWMAFLEKNNISHANWAYNDKLEGASALDSSGAYTESGQKARDIILNWPTAGEDNGGDNGGNDNPACEVIVVPGKIQAEDYCTMNGVKTQPTTDVGGGENVGWVDAGDTMAYRVNVSEAGQYIVSYRVAAQERQTALQLQSVDGEVYGLLDIAPTGGWQNWTTLSHKVELSKGQQDLIIKATDGAWNLNWLQLEKFDSDNGGNDNSDNAGECQGVTVYPNWTRKDWSGGEANHLEKGDQMVHEGKLYLAKWYTKTEPGSDNSWQFLSNCSQ